jgi:hypothetical protein
VPEDGRDAPEVGEKVPEEQDAMMPVVSSAHAKTIYKFYVPAETQPVLEMPRGWKFLSLQVQGGDPMMWVLVDPRQPLARFKFLLARTGDPIERSESLAYLGSFQVVGSYGMIKTSESITFHLFLFPEDRR